LYASTSTNSYPSDEFAGMSALTYVPTIDMARNTTLKRMKNLILRDLQN